MLSFIKGRLIAIASNWNTRFDKGLEQLGTRYLGSIFKGNAYTWYNKPLLRLQRKRNTPISTPLTLPKIKLEVFQTCLIYFTQPKTFMELIKTRFLDQEKTAQIIIDSSNNTDDDLDISDFSKLFLYVIK